MKTKEQKQQEWLNKIIADAEKQKTMSEEEKQDFIEKKKKEAEEQ